jgi:ribulose-phosphate 3-epimerase
VHLQTVRPERWLETVVEARPNRIIVHVEGVGDVFQALDRIRSGGAGVGLALLPGSPADLVGPYVRHADLVTVLSAGLEDGEFRGQTLDKVRWLAHRGVEVEVDGGITPRVVPMVARAGASMVVAGRAIFCQGVDRVAEAIAALREAAA